MPDFLIYVSVYITNIFSPAMVLLFCLFLLSISMLYLNIKHIHYRELLSVNCPNNVKGVLIISFASFLAAFLSGMLKEIFRVTRPTEMLVLETGYSFPSGHTAVIFAFSFAAIFILFKYFKNHHYIYLNYLHTTLFISTALLVSFTRIQLGVHRPIDLFFGMITGLFATYTAIKMYYTITKYVDFKTFK